MYQVKCKFMGSNENIIFFKNENKLLTLKLAWKMARGVFRLKRTSFWIICCYQSKNGFTLNNFWISTTHETQLTIPGKWFFYFNSNELYWLYYWIVCIEMCVYSDISHQEKRHQPLDIQEMFWKNEIMLLLYYHTTLYELYVTLKTHSSC